MPKRALATFVCMAPPSDRAVTLPVKEALSRPNVAPAAVTYRPPPLAFAVLLLKVTLPLVPRSTVAPVLARYMPPPLMLPAVLPLKPTLPPVAPEAMTTVPVTLAKTPPPLLLALLSVKVSVLMATFSVET